MRKLGLPEVKQFAQTSRNASGILIRSKQMLFFLSSLFGLLRQVFLHFFPWKIMEWPPRMEQEWAVETASTLASDCWMTLLLPQSHDSHLLTELFWAHCPKGQKTQIISERFILSNSHKKKKKSLKFSLWGPWVWLPTPEILAWRIPWTEESGRLQFMGSQRVGHNWETNIFTCTVITIFSLITWEYFD